MAGAVGRKDVVYFVTIRTGKVATQEQDLSGAVVRYVLGPGLLVAFVVLASRPRVGRRVHDPGHGRYH